MHTFKRVSGVAVITVFAVSLFGSQAFAEGNSALDILKQGLLGAGTGAISAGASGGKAGKGALIGAGTNVIGGALLSFFTDSQSSQRTVSYAQPTYYQAPQVVVPQPQVVQPSYSYQPEYTYVQQPASVTYSQPAPSTDYNRQIIKQGLLGAGTGAIASSVSGGKAGTGALVGAGTNVIGGALLDTLMAPSQSQSYYTAPLSYTPAYASPASNTGLHKHVIRKFDSKGNVISEEEIWE